jgi:hypothetical protein
LAVGAGGGRHFCSFFGVSEFERGEENGENKRNGETIAMNFRRREEMENAEIVTLLLELRSAGDAIGVGLRLPSPHSRYFDMI